MGVSHRVSPDKRVVAEDIADADVDSSLRPTIIYRE